jgi:hypothetical protein
MSIFEQELKEFVEDFPELAAQELQEFQDLCPDSYNEEEE